MRRFFCDSADMLDDKIYIRNEEKNHIANVLRLKTGDEIIVCFNDGYDNLCVIESVSKSEVIVKVLKRFLNATETSGEVTLFQAIPKGDKLDFIVQKSAELGVKEIYPFYSKYTVPKLKNEKVERLNRISLEASKQCERSKLLFVKEFITFNRMTQMLNDFDEVVFFFEREEKNFAEEILPTLKGLKKVAVVIGSEGGFSEDEAEALKKIGKSVSLGKRILRCETASIVGIALVMFFMGEMR